MLGGANAACEDSGLFLASKLPLAEGDAKFFRFHAPLVACCSEVQYKIGCHCCAINDDALAAKGVHCC
jgi:hypothetical protein